MAHKKIENIITKDFTNDDPLSDQSDLLSASANEMTGLTPTVAHDEDEAENYEKVFPYLPPLRPIPGGGVVVDIAEGIQWDYRTQVTSQKHKDK